MTFLVEPKPGALGTLVDLAYEEHGQHTVGLTFDGCVLTTEAGRFSLCRFVDCLIDVRECHFVACEFERCEGSLMAEWWAQQQRRLS